MPESRLFMSSCSRRELARRRHGGRAVPWPALVVGLLVVLVCAAAFLLGRGGI